jgi:hypothetical protein
MEVYHMHSICQKGQDSSYPCAQNKLTSFLKACKGRRSTFCCPPPLPKLKLATKFSVSEINFDLSEMHAKIIP